MTPENVSYAWALRFNSQASVGRMPLTGVFYFTARCEAWHDGMRTALFRTRREAREAAKVHGGKAYPTSMTPVRVRVSISEAR